MRIPCPFCGPRDTTEFSYLGDASLVSRPAPDTADAPIRFHEYLHERDNPDGPHRELWYHGSGCRSWLVVTRDTRTHWVERAEMVRSADWATKEVLS